MPNPDEWHSRFQVQANWTRAVRRHFASQYSLNSALRILEVGCGTGVILAEARQNPLGQMHGADLRLDFLRRAHENHPENKFTCADGMRLPYRAGAFDAVFCHYLLLWVKNPLVILTEMRRVTRRGGAILAFAEPDYGGRIDFPDDLAEIGRLQAESIQNQGADPQFGRKLRGMMVQSGLKNVEAGLLGGSWFGSPAQSERQSEWSVLEGDLSGIIDRDEWERLKKIDAQAWESGERILFVPTFYAAGLNL